jgi:hypothetical protein
MKPASERIMLLSKLNTLSSSSFNTFWLIFCMKRSLPKSTLNKDDLTVAKPFLRIELKVNFTFFEKLLLNITA